jgi:hypothetical protein
MINKGREIWPLPFCQTNQTQVGGGNNCLAQGGVHELETANQRVEKVTSCHKEGTRFWGRMQKMIQLLQV